MKTEEYENVLSIHRFPFQNFARSVILNISPLKQQTILKSRPNEMIGQQRAEQAMKFGLSVEQSGYNLFVVGPSGTGRMTYTQDSVAENG